MIHNSGICISIYNGQWAHVHDITYENINVEYSMNTKPQIYQQTDEQTYEQDYKPGEDMYMPDLIRVSDGRRNWQGHKSEDDPRCKITDVKYRNIRVVTDPGIVKEPKVLINRCMTCSDIRNITMENITVNGKVIEREEK